MPIPANNTPPWRTRPEHVKDLDDALEDVAVHWPGSWTNAATDALPDWWAVSTGEHGIVAYFAEESDAFAFRLDLINRWLNG